MKIVKAKNNEKKFIVTKLQLSINAAIEYCEQCKRLGLPKPKINGRVLIFQEPSPIKTILFSKIELSGFLQAFKTNDNLNQKNW